MDIINNDPVDSIENLMKVLEDLKKYLDNVDFDDPNLSKAKKLAIIELNDQIELLIDNLETAQLKQLYAQFTPIFAGLNVGIGNLTKNISMLNQMVVDLQAVNQVFKAITSLAKIAGVIS